MEYENTYASKAVGTAGLATGIIGTALGTLGSGILGNGGILGNTSTSEKVNDLQMDLIAANRALAISQSELAQEKKMVEVFEGMNTKVNAVRDELQAQIHSLESTVNSNAAAQAVINCGFNSSIGILQNQVAQFSGMTKLVIPSTNVLTVTTTSTT